MTRSRISVL